MREVTTVSTGSWALTCEAWGNDRACFAVWSPNAERVAAVGDFNEWDTFAYNYSQNEVQSFLMSSAGSGRAARRRKASSPPAGK
jgi:1,4-alpha-glucan branching enzyme